MEVNGFEIAVFQNSVVQPLQCTRHLGDKHFVEVLCYTYPCSYMNATHSLLDYYYNKDSCVESQGVDSSLASPPFSLHHSLTPSSHQTPMVNMAATSVLSVSVPFGGCSCGCSRRLVWLSRMQRPNGLTGEG